MNKIQHTIDFELIQKKLNNSITEQEELTFQQWLKEDESNLEYYQKAIFYFEKGSAFDEQPPNVNKAWEAIEKNISTPKKLTWRKTIGFGSVIAAMIAYAIFGLNLLDSLNPKMENNAIVEAEIIPGQSQAVLTLSDGSTKKLKNGEILDQNIDGVDISSDGQSIQYTENTESTSDLKFNTLLVPKGGEFFLKLSDGTKIWLNAETSLKYPVQFVGNQRNVELIGEAYFEVAKDKAKPFNVISGNQTIQVLGTAFNVSSYDDDPQIITTLIEGKVKVNSTGFEKNEQFLLPNQQSIMDKSSGEIIQMDVDPAQVILWKSGKFYFPNQTLGDMMKVLARWYDIDVFYDNETVRNVKFTGSFKRYDEFKNVKEIIEKTNEMKLIIKGRTVIIK